ncbi:polysaccharide biosynthesis tyrosine autokinase [Nocardioides sp.]|uniref:polysaccharide biosynthesis tyrosine autokinase n=1 Tax=Nocardioides sp. TaxID=35761 RepID=UPI003514B9A7
MLEFLAVVARRWRIVIGVVLVGILAAAGLTYQATPVYRASTQLFVAIDSSGTASELSFAGQFASQRVKSYPDLVDSPLVLQPTIDALGLGVTPQQLADEVSAEVAPNTVLLSVLVDDPSAAQAALIANTVAENLASVVEDLDRTREDSSSPVRVSVTRPAIPPTSARSPVPALNLTLGLVLGLLIGVALAALREALDTTIKDDGDVTEATGLPTLAHVPTNSDVSAQPLLDATPSNTVWAESYRKLRTNLSYIDPDNPARVITVTSALPGDGKSLTAANLASSLGQSGQRTILIEADLRRPSLVRLLGVSDDVGLSTVVAGRVPLEDAIQSSDYFDAVVSGPIPPNPSELLGTQVFSNLIETLKASYDRVIIDTPPLVAVTDAAIVATVSDAVLLVAQAKRTKRMDLRRAHYGLRAVDANLVGVVLNQVPVNSGLYYEYRSDKGRGRRG